MANATTRLPHRQFIAASSPIIHAPNVFKIQPAYVHSPPPLFPNPNENPEAAILEIPRRRLWKVTMRLRRGENNSTIHAMSESPDAADTARASENDGTFAHESSSRIYITRPSGRMRSLRPILIPPSFPSSRLLLIMSIPETSSSSDQNGTEADPSFSTTTITVKGLHPNTVKADIRPVFQRFGEVMRILIEPDGKRAAVVFADVHGIKNTLHSYAEKPLHVRGWEVTVFRKYTKMNKVFGMDRDRDRDTPSRGDTD